MNIDIVNWDSDTRLLVKKKKKRKRKLLHLTSLEQKVAVSSTLSKGYE